MTLNPNDPNVALLEVVAQRLGESLRHQLVFVGGAVAGLLITDAAMPSIRPTEDVDLVAEVWARGEFHDIEAALRAQGFTPDLSPNAPICRWCIDKVVVDVMATLEEVLGFTNSWYPSAVATAALWSLPSGVQIQVIQAPAFIATKLEAFANRGRGDYLFSHDVGDVVSVIDGRDELMDECAQSSEELACYLARQFKALLNNSDFMDALPGHLPTDAASQERLPDLIAKLRRLARLR